MLFLAKSFKYCNGLLAFFDYFSNFDRFFLGVSLYNVVFFSEFLEVDDFARPGVSKLFSVRATLSILHIFAGHRKKKKK